MSNIDYGQGERTLSIAEGKVSDAQADFNKLAKSLEGKILGYQSKWVGAGGSAFFALHQAWTEKQQTIVSALDEFRASLLSTEKDNVNTDETQSSTMSALTNKLGAL